MKQTFIGSRAILHVVDTGMKTPMGGVMLKVNFEDGSYEYMPEKRFEIVKSDEARDESFVRGALMSRTTKEIGSVVYSMLLEYGCRLAEIEPITNQVIAMTNAGSEKVNNILWGVDYAIREL